MGFLQDFMGQSQQNDLTNAYNTSNTDLQNGYNSAQGQYNQYAGQAQGALSPYTTNGANASNMYANALGLNGAGGGQNALTAYQSSQNPFLQYNQTQALNLTNAAANARGNLNSGANALAGATATQNMGYQDYQNWLAQMQGASAQGQQAGTTSANLYQQQGQYQGDLASGLGQQQAGAATNYGNAMAQSRSTGINNLLGVAGVGLKAAGIGGYAPSTGGGGSMAGWNNALTAQQNPGSWLTSTG